MFKNLTQNSQKKDTVITQAQSRSKIDTAQYKAENFSFTDTFRCTYASEYFYPDKPPEQLEVKMDIRKAKAQYPVTVFDGVEYPIYKLFESDKFIFYSAIARNGYVGTYAINKVTGEIRLAESNPDDSYKIVGLGFCRNQ